MNYLTAVDACFLDSPGGSQRVAWDIAKAARNQGWKVSMLCLNPGNGHLPDGPSESDGIEVVRYSRPATGNLNPLRPIKQIYAAGGAFNKWLRSTKWDTIHIHSPITGAGVIKSADPSARVVYTVHSPVVSEQRINWFNRSWSGNGRLFFGLPFLKWLEKKLLDRSDAIHALSEFTRTEMHRFHGIGEKITVVPHWCRDGFQKSFAVKRAREKLGWPADKTIFFTVRHHGKRYGIDIAIRALAGIDSKHVWKFYIGGDGPLRPELESLVSALGLEEQVIFTGYLRDETLALAYQAADAFLLPTTALECFGLILLEALACECPVISTDAGAIPEIMREILPDFIVPAGNVGAMKGKIEDLLEFRMNFPPSASLRQFANSRYGKSVIVPKILNLLGPSQQ